MTNPLTLFFATLATGWLSVVVVGTKYYLEVGPAADVVIERPPDPPPLPPLPSEAMNQFVSNASYDIADAAAKTPKTVTRSPVSEEVSRLVSHASYNIADAARAPRTVFLPPDALTLTRLAIEFGPAVAGAAVKIETGRLTIGRVDCAKGDVVVLVIGTHLTDEERKALNSEIASLRAALGERLVGSDVLVGDRAGLWRWSDWSAKAAGERRPFADDKDEFGRLFQTVADDLDAVARARGGKAVQRCVVWHSAAGHEQVPPAAAAVRVPGAALIWSGLERAQQRKCKPVHDVFDPESVAICGPDIEKVSKAVISFVVR